MWLDLLWTLLIYGVVFAIVWWIATTIESKVPFIAPFMWLAWVVLAVAAGAVCIGILIGNVPLIPFLQVGSARLR